MTDKVDVRNAIKGGQEGFISLLETLFANNEHLEKEVESLKSKITLLEKSFNLNDVLIDLDQSKDQVEIPSQVLIDAADAGIRNEDGFYSVEFSENSEAYRWTGPGEDVCFNFRIDRSTSRDFEFIFLSKSELLDVNTCFYSVDNCTPIPLTIVGNKLCGQLPISDKNIASLKLLYQLKESLNDEEKLDKRKLGFAFSTLVVGG